MAESKLSIYGFNVLWTVILILGDFIFYGGIIPFIAACLAGVLTNQLFLSPALEGLLVIPMTYFLLFGLFYFRLEAMFWKRLFTRSSFKGILMVRDSVNVLMALYYLSALFSHMELIANDGGFKQMQLSEGLPYLAVKPLVNYGVLDETWMDYFANPSNIDPPSLTEGTENNRVDSSISYFEKVFLTVMKQLGLLELTNTQKVFKTKLIQHQNKFIHGAEFMLIIAVITASVTKLIYFSTLYAYMRAMDIFVSMENDDDVVKIEENYEHERATRIMPWAKVPMGIKRGLAEEAITAVVAERDDDIERDK